MINSVYRTGVVYDVISIVLFVQLNSHFEHKGFGLRRQSFQSRYKRRKNIGAYIKDIGPGREGVSDVTDTIGKVLILGLRTSMLVQRESIDESISFCYGIFGRRSGERGGGGEDDRGGCKYQECVG